MRIKPGAGNTPLTLERARNLMRNWCGRRIAFIHGQGWAWLRDSYLPALATLKGQPDPDQQDRRLVSWAYYDLGDVHDFNKAPMAALRAYRRSIRWRDNSAAWREAGGMLQNMGRYEEAVSALERAVQLNKKDSDASFDLECAREDLASGAEPFFQESDKLWEAREHLARVHPRAALRTLSGVSGIEAHLHRARAYGVMGNGAAALAEFQAIGRMEGPVEFDWADLYFLEPTLWKNPVFWDELLALRSRYIYNVFLGDDSLFWCLWEGHSRPPAIRSTPESPEQQAARLEEHRRYFELIVRRMRALAARDRDALRALVARYPAWTTVANDLKRLEKRSPRPARTEGDGSDR